MQSNYVSYSFPSHTFSHSFSNLATAHTLLNPIQHLLLLVLLLLWPFRCWAPHALWKGVHSSTVVLQPSPLMLLPLHVPFPVSEAFPHTLSFLFVQVLLILNQSSPAPLLWRVSQPHAVDRAERPSLMFP